MEQLYTCPMDPDLTKKEPGKCPKCGMQLVPLQTKTHSDHQNMEENFKKRFFISLPLTFLVLILSPHIQKWFGYNLTFPGINFALFILASIIVFWAGLPFYQMAWGEIKLKSYGMMSLVSLATLSGYFFSAAATFLFPGENLFWEISTLVLAFLLGHWMEMRAVRGASGALTELAKLIPPTAHLIREKEVLDVNTDQLKKEDQILIKPGEKIPIDGVVIEGESSINEAMITGESQPVPKKVGDQVIGGTINSDGSLVIKVSKTGSETAIAQMMELVRQAQETKPAVQKLADKAASYLTFTALAVAISTFGYWFLINPHGAIFASTLAIATVVIACPHALGLAIPTVTTITSSLAAKNGILIKDMKAIEIARKVNLVIFDKTGTLTEGKFGVTDVISLGDSSLEEVLKLAASVEYHSEHPIAQGIVKEAKIRKLDFKVAKNFQSYPGKGAKGVLNDQQILVGNKTLLLDSGISLKDTEKTQKLEEAGKTFIWIVNNKEVIGVIALEDIIRPQSKQVISKLKEMGIKTAMLTGDNEAIAAVVAKKLGIDTFFAEVLPKDKVDKVKKLQQQGYKVAMVGDGVNDAPSLTQADVGIAIGAGTDVALESAEVVLVKDDPLDVVKAIMLSKLTNSKMVQNLAWAAGYNIVTIPLAAGILYPSFGILLRPEWSALIMSASSIIVVLNALLLRRQKLAVD